MSTVTIDGFIYDTTGRSMTPKVSKAQQNNVSLAGTTIIQNFSVTRLSWEFEILVHLAGNQPVGYGNLTQLQTSYLKNYVTFIDHNDTNQGDVIFENELELPLNFALVDPEAPFVVKLTLSQRLT